tara:strand:+ start:2046 stop:2381 length:336 start_codon:yes stop_codon:yes gene_type:complete
MSKEDKADIVEIEIHPFKLQFSNQTYPEPTREQILVAAREYLEANIFSYSEKRSNAVYEELNTEPITSRLGNFAEMDEAITKAKSIGRPSEEQGGNREGKSYNTDRDPFNE